MVLAALVLSALASRASASQTVPAANTVAAAPLLDMSGATLFWRVVDGVSVGTITPDSGRALLAGHPGYQQIEQSGNRLRVIQHCLRLMGPKVRRDTVPVPASTRPWLYPYVCDHLDSVRVHRVALESYAATLANDAAERARITAALDSALAQLPVGAREVGTPTIYGMFFEPGGFGGRTIAVDLLTHLRRASDERTRFLAHELHHALMTRLPSDVRAPSSTSPVPWWIGRLQWEGIASLLDKRAFIQLTPSGLAAANGATGFALEHATRMLASSTVLATVDSALTARRRADVLGSAAADSALRRVLEPAIPDGGHALGQYMALAIERHGGRAAIVNATTSRAAFLSAYQQAALAPGSFARPFSRDAMEHLRHALGPP